MAIIIDGKKVANEIYDNLKERIASLSFTPKLSVILVGENPSSMIYVNNKIKSCQELNIKSEVIRFNNDVSIEEIKNTIIELNNDDECKAILVQSPLPSHLDENEIFNLIDPKKDVDGFNNYNVGALTKKNPIIIPCTVKGIAYLLDYYNIDVKGKDVTIIGRSNIVGRPLANYLINKDATVTICHTKTKDLKSKTINADIVIVAAGHPKLVDETYIKDNAVVIDVGINRVDDKLCGDTTFDTLKNKCSYITPVPGGVGPMTVAMLMDNVVEISERW